MFATPGKDQETISCFKNVLTAHHGKPGRIVEIICDTCPRPFWRPRPEACVTVARFHGVQLFTAIETVEKHKEPILHRRASTHSNTRMETLNRIFKTARARTPSCPNVQTLHHHDLSDHHPNQRNIQIHLKRRGALFFDPQNWSISYRGQLSLICTDWRCQGIT